MLALSASSCYGDRISWKVRRMWTVADSTALPSSSAQPFRRLRRFVGSIEHGSRRLRDEIDNVVRYDLAFAGAIYFSDLSKFREARCKLR